MKLDFRLCCYCCEIIKKLFFSLNKIVLILPVELMSSILLRFCDEQPPEQTHVRLYSESSGPVLSPPRFSLCFL